MDISTILTSPGGILSIILAIIIGLPSLYNFIKWCKNLYKEREDFKKKYIEKGKKIEAEEKEEENRFKSGEERIALLEKGQTALHKQVNVIEGNLSLLLLASQSNLRIWLNQEYEKWMKIGYIDYKSLAEIEERFDIYTREGGNHGVERLIKDLRELPIASPVQTEKNNM